MKLGYTEFSFGYAFTENLIRASANAPSGAPVFPNLVQEAELGYDVQIDLPGFPLFFQFKLPNLLVRDSAKEIARHSLPLKTPFFRMDLMQKSVSQQHKLLVDLDTRCRTSVYYVSPLLSDQAEFNAAYGKVRVHRSSAFFSPTDIGPLPDNLKHSIAYRKGNNVGWFCSKPKEIRQLAYENIERHLQERFSGSEELGDLGSVANKIEDLVSDYLPEQLRNLKGEIRASIQSRLSTETNGHRKDDDLETRKVIESLLTTRQLALVGLGVYMVIAQPSP